MPCPTCGIGRAPEVLRACLPPAKEDAPMTPFDRAASTAVLLLAASNSPAQAAPAGVDAPAAGKRQVSGFNVVEIGGAITADVTVGPAFSVEVSGDPASVALVTTKVQGETLVVGR